MAPAQMIFEVDLFWEHQSLRLPSLDKEQLRRELYYKRLDRVTVFPTISHLEIKVHWHTARFTQAHHHQSAKGYGVR